MKMSVNLIVSILNDIRDDIRYIKNSVISSIGNLDFNKTTNTNLIEGIYMTSPRTDCYSEIFNFTSNFTVNQKDKNRNLIDISKLISKLGKLNEIVLRRYKQENISFVEFSIVDFEKFSESRLFEICNIFSRNPNIYQWIEKNILKKAQQQEIEIKIEEDSIKIEQIQQVMNILKYTGIIKVEFEINQKEKLIKINKFSVVNNNFLQYGWYELACISKMSGLYNSVIINNVKYKKGTYNGEIDLMIIKDNDIYVFEIKNTKSINTLSKGLDQLENIQKIFSLDSSHCFLVVNDIQLSEDKFDQISEKIRNKGFKLVKFSEVGNIW